MAKKAAPTKKSTTKKVKMKPEMATPPLNVAREIKKIGTDIGEKQTAPGQRSISISTDDMPPTWLVNLLTITTHAISLVETAIGGVVMGDFGTSLGGGRRLRIVIDEAPDAKIG